MSELIGALGAPGPAVARRRTDAARPCTSGRGPTGRGSRRGCPARCAPSAVGLDREQRIERPLGARPEELSVRVEREARSCGSVSAAASTSNDPSLTTRRPRTASSERPAGDQSASPSSRPSPHVIAWRPTRTKLGRIESVCASTQASNAPVTRHGARADRRARRSSRGRACARPAARPAPRAARAAASSPSRARSTSSAVVVPVEVVAVLAARAQLDDGRGAPSRPRRAAPARAARPAPPRSRALPVHARTANTPPVAQRLATGRR